MVRDVSVVPPVVRGRGWRRAVVVGLCAVGLLGLSGCGQGGGDDRVSSAQIKEHARELEERGYPEQAAMMADGEITAEEFQDAFDLFRKCLENAGEGIAAGPYTSPVDGLSLDYLIDPGEIEDPIAQGEIEIGCDDKYLQLLEPDYVYSHEPKMDPALHSALRECLAEKGFETSGEEKSVRDFVGEAAVDDPAGTDRDDVVVDCAHRELDRLYSDRQIVGTGLGW